MVDKLLLVMPDAYEDQRVEVGMAGSSAIPAVVERVTVGGSTPGAPDESVQVNVGGVLGGFGSMKAYEVGPDGFILALMARLGFGDGTAIVWFDSGNNPKGQAVYRPTPDELVIEPLGGARLRIPNLGRVAAFSISTAAPGASVKAGVALGGPPSDLADISGGNTIELHLGEAGANLPGTVLISVFGRFTTTTGSGVIELWNTAGIMGTYSPSGVGTEGCFSLVAPLEVDPGVDDEISVRVTSAPGPINFNDVRLYVTQITP